MQLNIVELCQDAESEKLFKTLLPTSMVSIKKILTGRQAMYYNCLSKICYSIKNDFELFLKMAFKYVLYLKDTPL